jgi:hypothetical protein
MKNNISQKSHGEQTNTTLFPSPIKLDFDSEKDPFSMKVLTDNRLNIPQLRF